ncbi:WD40 repeat domain-containing protein, partial [Cytophagaceae bacterium AH-315-L13]|nr:WD40 repeat domain-containing protein [Cytophagaceae bacterium AH-315-L13]
DGKYILTASRDNTARLWNVNTLESTVLKGHKGAMNWGNGGQINFSPNSKYVVTATSDSTARIWDLQGKCLAILKHDGPVNSVYFSPRPIAVISSDIRNLLPQNIKGEYLVLTASSDKTARLWDMDGNELVKYEGHEKGLRVAKFSSKVDRILTTAVNEVKLWDINGNIKANMIGHEKMVYYAFLNADSAKVYTFSWDGNVIIWGFSGAELKKIKAHNALIYAATISNNYKYLVSGGADKIFKIWKPDGELVAELRGHTATPWGVDYLEKNNIIVTSTDDGTARLWNLDGQELMLFKGHTSQILSANFSPDGKYVVTGSGDRTARIWNIEPKENPILKGHNSWVVDIDMSEDQQHIITAGWDYSAKIWNINGELISNLLGFSGYGVSIGRFIGNDKVLTACSDASVKIWNLNGEELINIEGYNTYNFHFDFNPVSKMILLHYIGYNIADLISIDGDKVQTFKEVVDIHFDTFNNSDTSSHYIYSINTDTTIGVWEIKTDTLGYKLINNLRGHTNVVNSLFYSSKQKCLLTTSGDSTLLIQNLKGEELFRTNFDKGHYSNAFFSQNEQHILTVNSDNSCSVFQMDFQNNSINYKIRSRLIGHSEGITSASFSKGDEYIVTGSSDFSRRVWNLEGDCVQILTGHKGLISKSIFVLEDNYILSSSYDHTARLTPWRVEDVLQKINVDKVRGEVWKLGEKDKEVFGIN